MRGWPNRLRRPAHNRGSAGSSPAPRTTAEIAQLVEYLLPKQNVAGSIPVFRSRLAIVMELVVMLALGASAERRKSSSLFNRTIYGAIDELAESRLVSISNAKLTDWLAHQ